MLNIYNIKSLFVIINRSIVVSVSIITSNSPYDLAIYETKTKTLIMIKLILVLKLA